jgi:hypothetical protein
MCLAENISQFTKGGFSHGAIEETQNMIKNPYSEVHEVTKLRVEYAGHKEVMAAIERQLTMYHQNKIPRCLPCHNSTANNPQTDWRCKGEGVPLPNEHRL